MKETSAKRAPAILFAVLGLALAVRVPFLNTPALSMRQSDNAGIARNYFEGGMHFLRPQIDWSGSGTGVDAVSFTATFEPASCTSDW